MGSRGGSRIYKRGGGGGQLKVLISWVEVCYAGTRGVCRKFLKNRCYNTAILETFPQKMHISACRNLIYCLYIYIYYIYIWLSAAFANGKVWVGSDNQVHDAPSHNCMHDRIIMLKLKFE